MTNRREAVTRLLAGAAVVMLAGGAIAKEAPEADALKALDPWGDALFSGAPDKVATVLAEEFQIARSDGTGFDKASYLKNLPKQNKRNSFSDIHATKFGDYMVIRYLADANQVIAGKATSGKAPRLSTFRLDGGKWLMTSHANFALLS
ncbi:MAG: nuclear transport factor 2 family protein [Devosia sp.]